ncbi:MAG TPA: peptide ABC transporter substrate-binding protein [Verrucomicrobiales bacterium]|nr:peptide ABC transporter substrate-binding protein [Verrucomicrobiales bacterium]
MKLLTPVLTFLALLLAGCSEREARRADLVFINGAEIGSIDPSQSTTQKESRVINSLFEGLMRFNSAGRAEPGCALEPVISPDGLTYTFTIRDNARWSDGTPVTSEDFVRSWRRVLLNSTASEYASILFCIAGAEAFNHEEDKPGNPEPDFSKVGVKAVSPRELVITLTNPLPYFRDLLAFMTFCPVNVRTLEKLPQAERDNYWKPGNLIGNGPYLLKEWRLNDRIRLEKNPAYWDAANVKLNTIDVLPIENPNTAINLFLTGAADLMIDKDLIPASIAEIISKKPYFHHKPFLGTWFIRFNTLKKPYGDARVRKALTMVIDRRRITDVITRLGEEPAFSISPPGVGNGYKPPAGITQNIAEARRLLAEAGYPDGRGFPVVDYLYPSKFPVENGIAVELQSMWKSTLGLTVSLRRQEQKVYFESQKKLDYELSRSSWVGDYNDPNTFLDLFTTTNGNNRTGWGIKAYDDLIAGAAREPDVAKRNQLLLEAETLLIEKECVIAPVYYYLGVQFYHADKLGGVEANLIDEHPLRSMYWK